MNRRYLVGGILTVAVIGALIYVYGGSQAPAGQAPLERLTAQNSADIKNTFNAAKGDVRVLLLLSLT